MQSGEFIDVFQVWHVVSEFFVCNSAAIKLWPLKLEQRIKLVSIVNQRGLSDLKHFAVSQFPFIS